MIAESNHWVIFSLTHAKVALKEWLSSTWMPKTCVNRPLQVRHRALKADAAPQKSPLTSRLPSGERERWWARRSKEVMHWRQATWGCGARQLVHSDNGAMIQSVNESISQETLSEGLPALATRTKATHLLSKPHVLYSNRPCSTMSKTPHLSSEAIAPLPQWTHRSLDEWFLDPDAMRQGLIHATRT